VADLGSPDDYDLEPVDHNPFLALPTSPNIEDRRQDPTDYSYWMKHSPGFASTDYSETGMGGGPMTQIPLNPMIAPDPTGGLQPSDVAPYSSSFQPGWKAQYSRQAPYRPSEFGPNLPHRDLVHLPISPGDPGWTSPPSPSGPHNVRGDPPRPGYDRPVFYPQSAYGGRIGFQAGGVTDLGAYDPSSIADKYITPSGETVPQRTAGADPTATSMVADKYTSGAQISDPEWMNMQEDWAQNEQRGAEWGAASESFDPGTMRFIGRTGGTLPQARAQLRTMYPSGAPGAEEPPAMQRAYSDLMRRSFQSAPVSQGARGGLGSLMPQMVGHPAPGLRNPYESRFAPETPPEGGFLPQPRESFANGGLTFSRPFYQGAWSPGG